MPTQAEKARAFRALHARDGAFVIPNPFDVGTARLLTMLGFEALATTSAGYAYTIGKPDGAVDRDAMLAQAAAIAAATPLPVSADLENGYADDPAEVAQTVRLAAQAGLVGCSIEDVPLGRAGGPYALEFAAERVRAAAEAARALPFAFTLTARAENFIAGHPVLDDTLARLRAYAQAGADVVYAPGVKTAEDIAAVVRATDRPVNVLGGLRGMETLGLRELSALGVKRVSTGSALSRAAVGAFLDAAHELRGRGTFAFAQRTMQYADLDATFAALPPL